MIESVFEVLNAIKYLNKEFLQRWLFIIQRMFFVMDPKINNFSYK